MSAETTTAELLLATRDFLREEILPGLDGRNAYLARVALNALGIAVREAEQGARTAGEEHARLCRLLGREGEIETLRRELCARIRQGEYDADDNALMAHLWTTLRARLAIDNPGYASLDGARGA